MQSLQLTASSMFRDLLAQQPTTAAKVAFAWQLAAGPALARAGAPHWSDDGVLRVRARDLAWLREIRRARPIVTDRLTALLGPDVIKRLVIE